MFSKLLEIFLLVYFLLEFTVQIVSLNTFIKVTAVATIHLEGKAILELGNMCLFFILTIVKSRTISKKLMWEKNINMHLCICIYGEKVLRWGTILNTFILIYPHAFHIIQSLQKRTAQKNVEKVTIRLHQTSLCRSGRNSYQGWRQTAWSDWVNEVI